MTVTRNSRRASTLSKQELTSRTSWSGDPFPSGRDVLSGAFSIEDRFSLFVLGFARRHGGAGGPMRHAANRRPPDGCSVRRRHDPGSLLDRCGQRDLISVTRFEVVTFDDDDFVGSLLIRPWDQGLFDEAVNAFLSSAIA